MKTKVFNSMKPWSLCAAIVLSACGAYAQTSLPAPGSGGSYRPGGFGGNSLMAPGTGGGFSPSYAPGPGLPPPPSWGSPWYNPGINAGLYPGSAGWTNSGMVNVMACGYDARGIWRTLPLRVAYQWNGVQYNVTVVNAWNPWADMWMRNVDVQAYNTSYFINGNTYDFYVPLSTGTFYFNL